MECWADEFRKWHESVIRKYPVEVYLELMQRREAWMASMKVTCCKDES